MSKHLGNILEPIPLMDRHGADARALVHALRRLAVVVAPRRAQGAGRDRVEGAAHVLVGGVVPVALRPRQRLGSRARVDRRAADPRWTGGRSREVHRLTAEVDAALEDFDTARAGRALAGYIDDLSNWYVRRSRRRFWDGDPAALATLHECLHVLTRLLAPFVPFVTERVWARAVRRPPGGRLGAPGAVADRRRHAGRRRARRAGRAGAPAGRARPLGAGRLEGEDPPAAGPGADLGAGLDGAAGRPARRGRATSSTWSSWPVWPTPASWSSCRVKPNFRELGTRFGKRTQAVATAIAARGPGRVRRGLPRRHGARSSSTARRSRSAATRSSSARRRGRAGRSPSPAADTVALDLELTHELRLLGLVRDIVRIVQEARKNAGFEVTDRIELWWRVGGSPEPAEAIRTHARSAGRGGARDGACTRARRTTGRRWFEAVDEELGLHIWLRARRVTGRSARPLVGQSALPGIRLAHRARHEAVVVGLARGIGSAA